MLVLAAGCGSPDSLDSGVKYCANDVVQLATWAHAPGCATPGRPEDAIASIERPASGESVDYQAIELRLNRLWDGNFPKVERLAYDHDDNYSLERTIPCGAPTDEGNIRRIRCEVPGDPVDSRRYRWKSLELVNEKCVARVKYGRVAPAQCTPAGSPAAVLLAGKDVPALYLP